MLAVPLSGLNGCRRGGTDLSRPPTHLGEALSYRVEGKTLAGWLEQANVGRFRAEWNLVLAFRTALGSDGSRWLAEAIAAGAIHNREVAYRVLNRDIAAAACASDLLAQWLLDSRDEELRVSIARLLVESGHANDQSIAVLRKGLRSVNASVAWTTWRNLDALGSEVDLFTEDILELVEAHPLERAFDVGRDGPTSGDLLGLLVDAGDRVNPSLPRIAALLEKPEHHLATLVVLDVLGRGAAADVGVVPLVARQANADDPAVRMAAARALGSIGVKSPEVMRALDSLCQDVVDDVRKSADEALARIEATMTK